MFLIRLDNEFFQVDPNKITSELLDCIREDEATILRLNEDGVFQEFDRNLLEFCDIDEFVSTDEEQIERDEIRRALLS